MAAKTQIIKYIGERGITAAKKFFGNSKDSGVASLSDEQLGRGLNMFEKKKADKAGAKAGAKSAAARRRAAKARRAEVKEANRTKKREPGKGGTQKNLRFRDKPTINIDVESDASRSVDETNLIRGARSAGRSTNQPGRTNIGSMSMANFIKDASKNYGVVQKRKKIDAEFQRRINLAETAAEKKKLKDALEKIRDQRGKKDEADLAATGRKISGSLQGKKRAKPEGDRSSALRAINDGELNPAFFRLNRNQQEALMRHAKATLKAPQFRRLEALREQEMLKKGDAPQLERAGAREVVVSPRVAEDAKKTLIMLFGKTEGTKRFNKIMSGATSKREFLVEIRSMVNKAKGKAGNKSGDIGAVVRGRGSSLDDASPDRGRKMKKGGMAKKGVPVVTVGIGMMPTPKGKKPRTGGKDFRNGGMVMATKNNLKPVPAGNKGLKKLPAAVRNKMGFMKKGGMVKK